MKKLFTIGMALFSQVAAAHCYIEAGQRYSVDPWLLKAIAVTESSLRPNILSATNDIGLMGINKSWLPTLYRRFGITERDVWEPCMNVYLGAWVLANNYRQYGKTWNAVGAYSAACTRLKGAACQQARLKYVNKVYRNWQRLRTSSQL